MEAFSKHLPRAVQLAHLLIRSRLNEGDSAVDATVGNGHDTLFLAKLVGPTGTVTGFDVQEIAIRTTAEKTANLPRINLHQTGHENAEQYIETPVKAVMFNLGYLPGAEKQIITRPGTTLQALDVFTRNLAENGIITIVLYTGHEGGPEEAAEIRQWCSQLDQTIYTVIEYGFVNQKNAPPSLIAIESKNQPVSKSTD